MWRTHLLRFASTAGLVAALGIVAAPAAHAQDRDDHHPAGGYAQRDDYAPGVVYAQRDDRGGQDRGGQMDRGDRGDRGDQGDRGDGDDRGPDRGDRGDRDQGQFAPPPVYVAPPAYQPPPVYVAPPPDYQPPTIVEPVPVPVMPDLNAYVLPQLEALFPGADFADYPPALLPLGNNVFALSSPQLSWTPDQAGTPQAIVAQLDQYSPNWGTAVIDGPQGYGVYLTYSA